MGVLGPLVTVDTCHSCGQPPADDRAPMVHSVVSWHLGCAPARPAAQLAAEAVHRAAAACPTCSGRVCGRCRWLLDYADRLYEEARS